MMSDDDARMSMGKAFQALALRYNRDDKKLSEALTGFCRWGNTDRKRSDGE